MTRNRDSTASTRRRPGRPRADRESLSRAAIIRAALSIIDQAGMPDLTMRRLATELGVDPMAIYHHVPGKRALVRALVAEVFGEFVATVGALPKADWQERIRGFAGAYLALGRAHPALVLHLVVDADAATSEILEATEILYAALADADLEPDEVVAGADLIVDWLNGVALAESGGAPGPGGARVTMRRLLADGPDGRFPVLQRTYDALDPRDEVVNTDAALDAILAGIEAMAGRRRGHVRERGRHGLGVILR